MYWFLASFPLQSGISNLAAIESVRMLCLLTIATAIQFYIISKATKPFSSLNLSDRIASIIQILSLVTVQWHDVQSISFSLCSLLAGWAKSNTKWHHSKRKKLLNHSMIQYFCMFTIQWATFFFLLHLLWKK